MKHLYRSRKNKIFGGICGGLGNYFSLDPAILRLLFICLCFLTVLFPLIICYLIALLIIPIEPINTKTANYKKLYRSLTNRKIAGVLGGISYAAKIDPSLLRFIYIFICVLTGFIPLIILYIIAWICIPEDESNIKYLNN